MTKAQKTFCDELETVSGQLADWARRMIREYSWSVDDCKVHLRAAAKVAGREA